MVFLVCNGLLVDFHRCHLLSAMVSRSDANPQKRDCSRIITKRYIEMRNTPIFREPPTFRDYDDFKMGIEYTRGWNDAMEAIFPEEAKKRQIEQAKKKLRIVQKPAE